MKLKSRILAMCAAAAVGIGALPAAPQAAAADLRCTADDGTNIGTNNYSRWTKTVKSALVPVDGGWMRVQGEAQAGKAVADFFDADFHLTARKAVDLQLPVWGGFYAASDGYYYLVSGQNNPDQDDELPVIDIAKYSTDWQLIKHASVSATNVMTPFDGSAVRFADNGQWLIIRTGRKMYNTHQSNLTLELNMSDMTVVENDASFEYQHMGYVSHSFNQFVLVDGKHIVALDHGDMYPRSAVLNFYQTDYTAGGFKPDYFETPCIEVNMVSFAAPADEENMSEVNYTGTSIGGFLQSSTHYLAAYNTVDQSKLSEYWQNSSDPYTRNIMIAALPKSSLNDESVVHYALTEYPDGAEKAQTPHLVQLSADRFAVLWQQGENVGFATVDGTGKPVGTASSAPGTLSDCVPVLRDGKLSWYTWKNGTITLSTLDPESPSEIEMAVFEGGHEYVMTSAPDDDGNAVLRCTVCDETKNVTVVTGFDVYWRSGEGTSGSYSTARPNGLDAGMYFAVWAYTNTPRSLAYENTDRTDDPQYIMEVVEGDAVLEGLSPEDFGDLRSVRVGQFDPESVSCKVRIYPRYYEALAKEFTLTFSHTYENGETVKPTVSAPGYITHVCSGCGHTYKEILPQLTDLSDESITVTAAECVYDGSAQEPALTVLRKNADGTETALQAGTDYTAVYSDNTAAGTAHVKLTAAADSLYVGGTVTCDFAIAPQPLTAEGITLANNTEADPEKVFAPDFTVTDAQGKVLTAEQDYTYSFSGEEGLLTVTGKGNYTGTVQKEFDPARIDLSGFMAEFASAELEASRETYYSGDAHTPELIISDGTRTLRAGTDYAVAYDHNTDAGIASVRSRAPAPIRA